MASRQTSTASSSKAIPMEMLEEQVWLSAAQNILSQNGGNPMHYTDIKRHILERNLVSVSGLKSTLEAALCRDTQQPNSIFTVLTGRPGYFALRADSQNASPQHPRSSPSPARTPKVIKLTAGALRGHGAVTKVKNTKAPATQMKSLLGKVQGAKATAGSTSTNGTANSKFEKKYRRLKKIVKDMIFLNAAVCDEAIRTEEKVATAKEERRFLLQRLLQQQALSELLAGKQSTPSSAQSIAHILGEMDSKKGKKSATTSAASKTKTARQILEESKPTPSGSSGKGKKTTKGSNKRLVQPIPLDNSGRPIFPIELGHLTVYCLGDVTSDRPGFHTPEHIFPVGFYSTRVYQSLDPRHETCLYNCKIIDGGGSGPKFEICAELEGQNERHIFTGFTASECHNKLLQTIKHIRGEDHVQLGDKGADFFGFSFPTIQNLIQSLPGARKCSRYKWVKFEVNREGLYYVEEDPAVNYDVLCKIRSEGTSSSTPQVAAQTPSTSLHNLLTA